MVQPIRLPIAGDWKEEEFLAERERERERERARGRGSSKKHFKLELAAGRIGFIGRPGGHLNKQCLSSAVRPNWFSGTHEIPRLLIANNSANKMLLKRCSIAGFNVQLSS